MKLQATESKSRQQAGLMGEMQQRTQSIEGIVQQAAEKIQAETERAVAAEGRNKELAADLAAANRHIQKGLEDANNLNAALEASKALTLTLTLTLILTLIGRRPKPNAPVSRQSYPRCAPSFRRF